MNSFGRFLLNSTSLPSDALAPGLRNLQHFSYITNRTSTELNLIAPMFTFPSLRSIEAHGIRASRNHRMRHHRAEDQATQAYNHYHGSPITKLHLKNSDIHGNILTQILHIPQALTHFECSSQDHDNFSGHGFAQAFQILKPTLQHLKLNLRPPAPIAADADFGVGSFHDFMALRTISCASYTLMARHTRLVQVLPPALERLTIRVPWRLPNDEVGNLKDLAARKMLRFQRLGEVVLYAYSMPPRLRGTRTGVVTLMDNREDLVRLFEEVGVGVVVETIEV